MAKQTILWTVLPNGRASEGPHAGRLRVSVVASPRLTPEAADEQVLKAFADWRHWPKTLDDVKFELRIGAQAVALEPTSRGDPDLWARLFRDDTPVAGFQFRNMADVNLRSFQVRSVLGFLRRHYGRLAVESAGSHPTLLPWKDAHPALKGLITELGTRTEKINLGDRQLELPHPGFDRLLDEKTERALRAQVFGPEGQYHTSCAGIGVDDQGNPTAGGPFRIRVLPSHWQDPAGGGPDAQLMRQWTSPDEYMLYQADRFYHREPSSDAQRTLRRPDGVGVAAPPELPEFDFHHLVASYGDFPQLLRRLGLVIDCVLPPDSPIDRLLAGAPEARGLMALELRWGRHHDPADDSCPQTAWQADKLRFVTRARTDDHDRGLLRLENADDRWGPDARSLFDVYQVDPDGSALKTADFLLTAQRLVARSLDLGADGRVTYTTGDEQPVAALRSAGLGVSRHGRAAAVAQGAAAAALKDQAVRAGPLASGKVVLFIEDVLRGYRVDVQALPDGRAERWRSLCQREGEYRFVGSDETIQLPDDEGYVSGASTTSSARAAPGSALADDHYLHESLFRWTGWSLVAPRPGRTLRARIDPATGVQGETPEDVTDDAGAKGNGLAVSFKARKGSLPRLRFGTPYRLRARLTDLAGNSLAPDDPALEDDRNATRPVTYWRFEPVDPPALVQRTRTSEGESLERLVIRSNHDADTTAYLSSAPFAAATALPASADFHYGAVAERHVVPPKASQQQCETHGMFDAMWATPADIKAAYAIAAREAGTLYDAGASAQVDLITPAALAGVATTTALPLRLPSPDNPTGDRLAPGQYVIHREALVETPYLSDPAAGGLALRAMPGHALPGVTGPMVLGPSAAVVIAPNQELVLLVAHAKEWPDTQGLRLVLAERSAELTDPPCAEAFVDEGMPKWNEEARELTLFVAKGRIVRLRYSSFVHQDFIGCFGLPDWTEGGGAQEFVRGMAQVGCTWMVTPFRPLVLVHATQQPVCEPRLLALTAQRRLGDPHATLLARIGLHGPSSGKFEVEAEWDEWVDDPDQPGPILQRSRGALGEVLLGENHANLFSLDAAIDAQQAPPPLQGVTNRQQRARGDRHEFGDTKFRLVRYTLRATTRFREYLPAALYDQRDAVTRVGPIADGPAMNVGADDDPGAPVLALPSGSAPHTIVPASAPPDAPRVLYVVPTFRWSETAGEGSLDSVRVGNGLRVWLDRPWFSSGNGELLGVIILGDDAPFTSVTPTLIPLVTQWGLDPFWDTDLPKERSRVVDFPARVVDERVVLQEIDRTVHVIGHRVRWDPSRRLWYCDIELDPGRSYMPFVRLALVRYQPNAIESPLSLDPLATKVAAKISKVVLAEFAQVLPRRRAQFQRQGAQLAFTLHGSVPRHGPMKWRPEEQPFADISFAQPGANAETGRNRIELVLQTRDPALDSDLAWSDVSVLASSLVSPEAAPAPAAGGGGLRPGELLPGPLLGGLGRRFDLTSAVGVGRVIGANDAAAPLRPGLQGPALGALFDPVIWQTSTALPETNGKPARVVVHEYERYYTDRTQPERRGAGTRRRKVVEERLVYSALFDL